MCEIFIFHSNTKPFILMFPVKVVLTALCSTNSMLFTASANYKNQMIECFRHLVAIALQY